MVGLKKGVIAVAEKEICGNVLISNPTHARDLTLGFVHQVFIAERLDFSIGYRWTV